MWTTWWLCWQVRGFLGFTYQHQLWPCCQVNSPWLQLVHLPRLAVTDTALAVAVLARLAQLRTPSPPGLQVSAAALYFTDTYLYFTNTCYYYYI
jgi:hypothetical protein